MYPCELKKDCTIFSCNVCEHLCKIMNPLEYIESEKQKRKYVIMYDNEYLSKIKFSEDGWTANCIYRKNIKEALKFSLNELMHIWDKTRRTVKEIIRS